MKREREEEVGSAGAAMSPSFGPPSTSSTARVFLLSRAMEAPSAFHSLRAPSPFVRAMRTRLDPPPPPPSLAAVPAPPLPPPQMPEKRRRGRPRNCDRVLPPPGFLLTPPARAAPPSPTLATHGEASCQLTTLLDCLPCNLLNFVDRALPIPIGWAPAARAQNRCGRGNALCSMLASS